VDLEIVVDGKKLVIGKIYESKLPRCRRVGCKNRIGAIRVLNAIGFGRDAPLYCSTPCAVSMAQRNQRKRKKLAKEVGAAIDALSLKKAPSTKKKRRR
jgi:hypothetical protein